MLAPIRWVQKGLSEFTDWYARNGFRKLSEARGYGASWSGESVTEESAGNLSTVWICKRRISESSAMLPLQLMQEAKAGKFPATTHPMYRALKNAPNDEMAAISFREALTGHCLMTGNGYAQIFRRSGTHEANELWPLQPSQVTPDREKAGAKRLVYVVTEGNAASKTFTVARGKPHDILHIPGLSHDGITGFSVLAMARQSLGTAQAAERHVGRFYARGGRLPYNLKLQQKWASTHLGEKFRDDWNKIYSNPHEAPILEPNVEYQQTGISFADAQLLESRQWSVSDICRWFLLSPHLAGDLSHATFSNIEQLALEFVNLTLMPWLNRWEENLWRCILTTEEKNQGLFFKHNANALLRGDFLARMQGYGMALQNGWLNQNEVRDYEDLNRFDGGDDFHIQLNMQPLPTPTASQTASLQKLGTATKGWIH
jgi:HK97 family phage portal protein